MQLPQSSEMLQVLLALGEVFVVFFLEDGVVVIQDGSYLVGHTTGMLVQLL